MHCETAQGHHGLGFCFFCANKSRGNRRLRPTRRYLRTARTASFSAGGNGSREVIMGSALGHPSISKRANNMASNDREWLNRKPSSHLIGGVSTAKPQVRPPGVIAPGEERIAIRRSRKPPVVHVALITSTASSVKRVNATESSHLPLPLCSPMLLRLCVACVIYE